MTDLVVKRGRSRRTHSEQFKQELVLLCSKPGMSLANVARQHGLHPNLLSRWRNERLGPSVDPQTTVASLRPQFFPVGIQPPQTVFSKAAANPDSSKVEVNIDRGDLRIAFKVDPSQMVELGQVLREVLR